MLRRRAVYGATGGNHREADVARRDTVALNDADRLKLAEIERRLEHDPTIARVLRRRPRIPGSRPGQPSAPCWPT
jgi:hypothetical protein